MASDDGSAQDSVWPQPKFYFSVQIGDGEAMAFQEVSGLDVETEAIKYRAGESKLLSKVKLPGMVKSANVTLKRGVFAADNRIFDWFNEIKMNTISRQKVTIKLLDGDGQATMVWRLTNAFPTKISGTDLNAEGNEVAVEEIELAHEGILIENG